VRWWSVSFESIQIGVSVGLLSFGNKYSRRLHFGMGRLGKGEENGMLRCRRERSIWKGTTINFAEQQVLSNSRKVHHGCDLYRITKVGVPR